MVEKLLSPAVEELSIPPWLVRSIFEDSVDDAWSCSLVELSKRSMAVTAKQNSGTYTNALRDLIPLLENLNNKVWGREIFERVNTYKLTTG